MGSCVAGVEGLEVIAGGGFAVGRLAEGFEAGIREVHGVGIEEAGGVVFDPRQQAAIQDVGGHGCFELRPADEEDEGMNVILVDAQELCQGFHMEVVLMERILKAVSGPIDLLGPLPLFFGAEDPTFVVFRFDDEDAEFRNDDMVELGAAFSVRTWQIEIVELPVNLRIQSVESAANHPFTDPPFDGG